MCVYGWECGLRYYSLVAPGGGVRFGGIGGGGLARVGGDFLADLFLNLLMTTPTRRIGGDAVAAFSLSQCLNG